MTALTLSHSVDAATLTYTKYNDFVAATAGQNVVANALDAIAPSTLESGDTLNGISYAFSIYNRKDPNQPNGTTGQVSILNDRKLLTPPGIGTSFQPGGLSGENDTVTLTFASPITAFGASLGIAALSNFSIISDTGPSATISTFTSYGEQTASYADFFLGMVSDTPFSSVTLSGGNRYAGGTVSAWSGWSVTRISYASPVPLPASWLMFIAGLGFSTLRLTSRKRVARCET